LILFASDPNPWHIENMDQGLNAPLSPGEIASLKEVAKGMMQKHGVIPAGDREKLARMGLIVQGMSGFKLTSAGQARVAREK
jgi:hypothetical protein